MCDFHIDQHQSLLAGVANSEMTFGDTSEAPASKKQRKAGKAGKKSQPEEDKGEEAAAAMKTSPSGSNATGGMAEPEIADSEPAELTRTGAAEVVADADASVPSARGIQTGITTYGARSCVKCIDNFAIRQHAVFVPSESSGTRRDTWQIQATASIVAMWH